MGLILDDVKILAELAKSGVSFKETLTLGRQQLFLTPSELVERLQSLGFEKERISKFLTSTHDRGSAEPLFELLGAERVNSMDFSTYEGATIQHDLNVPIATDLHDRFDAVVDGGTLEHVFNFPVAMRNAMEMVRPGGSLIIITPANNQFGHGFYQFSPELFYNVLSEANGFHVEKMVAIELSPAHRQYNVADPSSVRGRVTLTNSWPVSLFVHAKRVKTVPLFTRTPQQTDYSAAWKSQSQSSDLSNTQIAYGPSTGMSAKSRVRHFVLKSMPGCISFIATLRQVFFNRQAGFGNSKFFKERPYQ
jgi:SAM-dependent methyltransferase